MPPPPNEADAENGNWRVRPVPVGLARHLMDNGPSVVLDMSDGDGIIAVFTIKLYSSNFPSGRLVDAVHNKEAIAVSTFRAEYDRFRASWQPMVAQGEMTEEMYERLLDSTMVVQLEQIVADGATLGMCESVRINGSSFAAALRLRYRALARQERVPATVVTTGSLDARGVAQAVSGLRGKYKAACRALQGFGIDLLVPAANTSDGGEEPGQRHLNDGNPSRKLNISLRAQDRVVAYHGWEDANVLVFQPGAEHEAPVPAAVPELPQEDPVADAFLQRRHDVGGPRPSRSWSVPPALTTTRTALNIFPRAAPTLVEVTIMFYSERVLPPLPLLAKVDDAVLVKRHVDVSGWDTELPPVVQLQLQRGLAHLIRRFDLQATNFRCFIDFSSMDLAVSAAATPFLMLICWVLGLSEVPPSLVPVFELVMGDPNRLTLTVPDAVDLELVRCQRKCVLLPRHVHVVRPHGQAAHAEVQVVQYEELEQLCRVASCVWTEQHREASETAVRGVVTRLATSVGMPEVAETHGAAIVQGLHHIPLLPRASHVVQMPEGAPVTRVVRPVATGAVLGSVPAGAVRVAMVQDAPPAPEEPAPAVNHGHNLRSRGGGGGGRGGRGGGRGNGGAAAVAAAGGRGRGGGNAGRGRGAGRGGRGQ